MKSTRRKKVAKKTEKRVKRARASKPIALSQTSRLMRALKRTYQSVLMRIVTINKSRMIKRQSYLRTTMILTDPQVRRGTKKILYKLS